MKPGNRQFIELQWCQFLQKLHPKVRLADKEGIKKLRTSSVCAEEVFCILKYRQMEGLPNDFN